jgi:hypothetical protein
MTRKIILLHAFTALMEPRHFTTSVVTPRGYKAGVVILVQPTSSCTISPHFFASFPMAEKGEGHRETYLKETREGC